MSVASILQKSIRTILDEGPGVAVAKAARRVRFIVDVAIATWRLRSEAKRPRDLDKSLDFAFGFSVGAVTIAPAQVRSEIRALLQLLEAKTPRNILEIGTARGGTLFLLSRVGAVDASLASVDLPGGEFGGGYGRIWVPLLRAMPSERQTLRLIRGDSHDLRTYEETRRWLGGEPLDCLLIDGDHRFEGVRRDFLMYAPLVRPGGVIAIHDIVPGRQDKVGGVPRFWDLVKKVYETRELVDDWGQGGFGIGVVQVPVQRVNIAALFVDPSTADDTGDSEALA
jgi:predicted O-methyltransferase YrrM